ncbi:DUF6882 domain-containing protein [Corynebacterium epidermidicanis]|uniref:Uncharacterized protein n=1 Tax=Corynebacterium epidermidicanis TaxID=1050174 RepID=A0A0G3GV54_9CORY|nr:DUF6882 domain-containing protein [Corynebacterium epidermidicanis]AKK02707.1 hypothetical protein CEPID_04170 [Corynebacterium epidermidicanis]
MHLAAPRTLNELAEDGKINQADIDAHFNQFLGAVNATEVARTNDGFTVRFGRSGHPDLDVPARLVATIQDDQWHWNLPQAATAASSFNIPELNSPTPAINLDVLTAAARTLCDDAPIIRVPFNDHVTVLALTIAPSRSTAQQALLNGPWDPTPRELTAFAVRRGLASLPPHTTTKELRTTSYYLSREHQMLFDARVNSNPQLAAALPQLGIPLGHVSNGLWTWADSPLVRHLRNFGQEHTMPVFVRPQVPLDVAQKLNLIDCAKAASQVWTHVFIPLTPTAYRVVLLQHPEFTVPVATREVIHAVLSQPPAGDIDQDAAREEYLEHVRLRAENR